MNAECFNFCQIEWREASTYEIKTTMYVQICSNSYDGRREGGWTGGLTSTAENAITEITY